MTDIVNMQTRIPKPGMFKEVLDEMATQFKKIDRPGVIYFPTSQFQLIKSGITAAFPSTTSDSENYMDSVLEDESSDYWKYLKSVGSKCESMSQNSLIVIEDTENNLTAPKFLLRTFIKAKRGKAPRVIEILKEIRAKRDDKPMIARPLAGSWDIVRLSTPFESLEDLTQMFEKIRTPENQNLITEMSDITLEMFRDVNRIYISNWPS